MTTIAQEYRHFKANSIYPWCWACGRDESQRPDRWWAEWWVDRAHVVKSPRVEDIRLVVLLCRLCHERSAGARISACEGHDWPKLTVSHLLYLKKLRDHDNFDREFLQQFSVQRLPRALRLPLEYRRAYHTRHPEFVPVPQ